jgi:hypothetical protein
MTRLMSSMARTPAPALLATATLAALNYDSKAPVTGEPKSTCFDAALPRDLSETYKSLDLAGHPGAVCVLVPKVEIDDETALRILSGSTMNGRYIDDDDAAKKLLADDMAGTLNIDQCLGNGVAISHHREPHLIAGIVHRRGVHLALDD